MLLSVSRDRTFLLGFLLICLALTAYRLFALQLAAPPLFSDEAYYWTWSRSLEFGYFSKPPLLGWLIALSTGIGGDTAFFVRLGTAVLYPLTAIGVFLAARKLFDGPIAILAGVTYLTLPTVSFYYWFATTDAILLCSWAWSLFLLCRNLDSTNLRGWVGLGVVMGLGMLGKYTMMFFPISMFVLFAFDPAHRRWLRKPGPYLALLLSIVVLSPNLIWNLLHDAPTIRHTAEISHLDDAGLRPDKLAEFWLTQLAVFGPILLVILVLLLIRIRSTLRRPENRLLIAFVVPLALAMSFQALAHHAFANWAQPIYVSATILVVWATVLWNRRWLLYASWTLHLVLAAGFYHFHPLANAIGIELKRSNDPYQRVLGWDTVGTEVGKRLAQYPDASLLADNRNELAWFIFYGDRERPYAIWNPNAEVTDHYRMTADLADAAGDSFLYIGKRTPTERFLQSFGKVEELESVRVEVYPELIREFQVVLLEDFQGY